MSSLFSSINSGVSGLNAQSMAMSSTAGNISNIESIGYKGTKVSFKTLVSPGESGANGVIPYKQSSISVNGEINYDSYNTETNMAIDGAGMFAVNTKSDKTGKTYFTRNGSFNKDENGNFKNSDNVFLMAWKVGDENQNKVENLEAVNMSGIGSEAVPTKKISLSMNLDAGQEKAGGSAIKVTLTSAHNTNLALTDVIYPDEKLQVGDAITIATSGASGAQTNNFTYGGITESAVVSNSKPMLGAKNADANFNALKEGDKFIINTATTGDVLFSYTASSPDSKNGTFNNLTTLAKAISYKDGYSARVVDDNLYITPINANDGMTFKNVNNDVIGLSKNLNGVFMQADPKNVAESFVIGASNPIFGATSSTATFAGLTAADKLVIRLADGTEYTATYAAAPSAAAATFNSLKTLSDAIDLSLKLDSVVVNSNQLRINVANATADNAIVSISSLGPNDVAKVLGVKIDSTFKGVASAGDKLEIAIGAYDTVTAKPGLDPTSMLTQVNKITGKKVTDGGILGANTSAAVFTELNNGDSIAFNIAGKPLSTFVFRAAPAAVGEFNSMDTLVTTINSIIGANTASISNGAIEIASSGVSYINSISSANNKKLPAELGLQFSTPTANDTIEIALDSGESSTFVFKNSAAPDQSKGEFNSIATLQSAINSLLNGKISADIVGSNLSLKPGTKMPSTMFSVKGNVANQLGMTASSQILSFNFVGSGSNPNTSSGEFNDLFTLRDAINKQSGGMLTASIISGGTRLSIIGNNSGKIKYINDFNVNGTSNFATNMGLKNADIVKALGLSNTVNASNQFSTLEGLSELVSNADGVRAETAGNSLNIFADNVLDTVTFSNAVGNSGDLLNLLNLPITPVEPSYDALDNTRNMASGKIKPSFFSDISVFDSLGDSHSLRLGFIKFDANSWGLEVYTNETSEVNNNRQDGLLASGNITFNSDGIIDNLEFKSLSGAGGNDSFAANWTNGSSVSDIVLDIGKSPQGTIQDDVESKGLRQFYANYNIDEFDQDGSKVASVNRIYIDNNGYVNASFDNGTFRSVYRVPIATFVSPDNLHLDNGNLYLQTGESGEYSLKRVGENGAGNIFTKAIEISNVDLSSELQNLMSINQMYQSCLKILHTANFLIGELNKVIT